MGWQVKEFINKHKGKDFLIVCTGKTLYKLSSEVRKFSVFNYTMTMGINTCTRILIPSYHVFTNNDRIKTYIGEHNSYSTLLIGSHIKERNIPKIDHHIIKYTDRDPDEPIGYENDTIKGYYRTGGCLMIMMAHLMGAKNIYVAGMDGFCYNFDGNVHFHFDDRRNKNNVKEFKEWYDYDTKVIKVLSNLKEYGINFKIITPTVYKEHYENIMDLS